MAKALAECVTREQRVAFIGGVIARQRAGAQPRRALTASVAPAVSKARISNRTKPVSPKPAKLAAQDEQQRLRHAVHEAAHAVVGVLCGAEVASVEVYPFGTEGKPANSGGQCVMVPSDAVVAQQESLIAASGHVAEAVMLHGPRPTGTQIEARFTGGVGSDRHRIRRLEPEVGWGLSPTSEALPLVLRCWPAICSLAVRIDSGRETRHKHVLAALGVRYDDEAAFALASIRAGVRTVPDPRRSAAR